jgi:lipopolysaccharide transport system permease protein
MTPVASSSAVSRSSHTTPVPSVVIEPVGGFFDFDLRALWEHRELIYFMVWREVKSKYKQTVLGFGWTIVQPLLTTAIFWVIFSQFARVQSDGIPYPLFAFSGLLPWNYFSQAVSRSSSGLVGNANLVGKVYFPRLILPLSAVLVPIIDFLISLVVFIVLMLWYGMMPTAAMLALPLFMFVAFLTALGMGLWLSALHVKYRDIAVLVPFVVQVWMYASPVIYPLTMIPERWELLRRWYGLNPMVGVVSGVRWALTGGALPDARVAAISLIVVVAIFLSGLVYFRRAERQFADLI